MFLRSENQKDCERVVTTSVSCESLKHLNTDFNFKKFNKLKTTSFAQVVMARHGLSTSRPSVSFRTLPPENHLGGCEMQEGFDFQVQKCVEELRHGEQVLEAGPLTEPWVMRF